MTARPLPSDAADAESAWLKAEVAALGPDPDAAALAAFEARCEQRFQAFRAENERRLAEIESEYLASAPRVEAPTTPVFRPWRAVPILVLLAWVLLGVLLEVTIGEVFVFSRSKAYFEAAPWAFLALLPPLGWALAGRTARRQMKSRYPTWVVRWLFVYPLAVAVSAGGMIVAPLGWAALAGWAVGSPAVMEATVISVDTRSRLGRCGTKGRMRVAGQEATLCLSRLIGDGRPPRPGTEVQVSGLSSGLGLFLQEVRSR